MGFSIYDDEGSKQKRSSSPSGYIESDTDILVSLQILKKTRAGIEANPNFPATPTEIRDFLTWASGSKKIPLPPLARRILCLKRALIKNSIASAGPSKMQRTGEKQQLEEIEALLRADGAKNLDDPNKCATEGSKWVSYSRGAGPTTTTSATGGPGCTTTVNCAGDSELVKALADIQTKLNEMAGKSPAAADSFAPLQPKLDEILSLLRDIHTVVGLPGAEMNLSKQLVKVQQTLDDMKTRPTATTAATEPPVATSAAVIDNNAASVASTNSGLSVISERLNELTQKIDRFIPPPQPGPQPPTIIARALVGEPGPTIAATNQPLKPVLQQPEQPEQPEQPQPQQQQPAPTTAEREEMLELVRQIQAQITSLPMLEIQGQLEQMRGFIEKLPLVQRKDVLLAANDIHTKLDDLFSHFVSEFDDTNRLITRLQEKVDEIDLNNLNENINRYLDRKTSELSDLINEIKDDIVRVVQALHLETQESIRRVGAESAERNTRTHTQLNRIEAKLDALKGSHNEERRDADASHEVLLQQMRGLQNRIEAIRCPELNTTPIQDALRAYTTELQAQLQTLRATNANGRNAGRIAQIQALEQRIRELEPQIEDCNEHRSRLQGLETELANAQRELERLRGEGAGKNGRIHELTEAAEARNRTIAEKEREISELRAQIEQAAFDTRDELERTQENIRRLEEEKRLLQEEIEHGQRMILELQDTEHQLRINLNSKNDEIRNGVRMVSELQDTEHKLRINLNSKNDEIRNGVRMVSELQGQLEREREEHLAAAEAAQRRISELEEELTVIDNDDKQYIAEMSNRKESEIRDLQSQLEALRLEHATEVARADALSAQIEELQTQIRERTEGSGANARTIARLTKENADLERRLRECDETLAALRASKEEVERGRASNTEAHAANIQHLREQNDRVISQLRTQISNYEEQLREKTRECAEQLAAMKNKHNANMNKESKNCANSIEEALNEAQAERNALQPKLEEYGKRIKTLEKELATAQGKASQLQVKDSEIQRLQERIRALEEEKAELTASLAAKLAEAKQDCDERVEELDEAKRKAESQRDEAQRAKSDCDSEKVVLSRRIEELDAMSRSAQSDKARAEAQRDAARKAASDCDEELRQKTGEHNALKAEKTETNELLRRAIEEKTASEMARADSNRKLVTKPATRKVPDLMTVEARMLLPTIKEAFTKAMNYSNRGAPNTAIPDVSGLFLRLLGNYRIKSDLGLKSDLRLLFENTKTGQTIKGFLKDVIKPSTPPMKQFEELINFLLNLPPEIQNYRTHGGRRTVKHRKERKSSRFSRK